MISTKIITYIESDNKSSFNIWMNNSLFNKSTTTTLSVLELDLKIFPYQLIHNNSVPTNLGVKLKAY